MRGSMALALIALLAACGDDGGEAGPDASVVGIPGTYTVRGTAFYEDRPQLMSGLLGDLTPKPARFVGIAVYRGEEPTPLVEGETGSDGTFELSFDATGGDLVNITLVSFSDNAARPIAVVKRLATDYHAFESAPFAAGVVTSQDVTATAASMTAPAFNVYDQMVDAMAAINTAYNPTPRPVTVYWSPGSQDGTYYTNRTIHLLGGPEDDDGYDDTVILHEAGHYTEDMEGRSDSPGGAHGGGVDDPRLAWSEGFATYFAMVVSKKPVYIDTARDGGWSYNGDTSVTMANINGGQLQEISEDLVTEVLWDLGDGEGADDDLVVGTHDAVLQVQKAHLKVGPLRDAASVAGVDLVDGLDGWFKAGGLGACAAARTVIQTNRKFPYDFAGPAGACP